MDFISSSMNDNNICRGCMSIGLIMTNIIENGNVLNTFTQCTQLEVNENDGLPLFLCNHCIEQSVAWLTFKTQCQDSEKQFRQRIAMIKSEFPDNASHVETSTDSTKNELLHDSDSLHIESVKTEIEEYFDMESSDDINDKTSDFDEAIETSMKQMESFCETSIKSETNAGNIEAKMTSSESSKTKASQSNEANPTITKEVCHVCNKEFSFPYGIASHLRSHGIKRSFNCEDCGNVYSTLYAWQDHRVLSHGAPARHICDICGKPFYHLSALKRHKTIHVTETPFKCDICSKAFRRQYLLLRHISTHDKTKTFKCNECDKTLTTKEGIETHIKAHHKKSKPYRCDLCGMSFLWPSYLETHKRVHTGVHPYKCDICKRTFSKKKTLQIHTFQHTGERPFPCTFCDKAFIVKYKLKTHLRYHSVERNFPCTLCSKAFTDQKKLKRHMVAVNENDGLPLFLCNHCIEQCLAWLSFKTQCHNSEEKFRKGIATKFKSIENEAATENTKIELLHDSDSLTDIIGLVEVNIKVEEHSELESLNAAEEETSTKEMESYTDATDIEVRIASTNAKRSKSSTSSKLKPSKVRILSKTVSKCKLPKTENSKPEPLQSQETNQTIRKEVCPVCNKVYSSMTGIVRHFRSHGLKRFYNCENCEKVFNTFRTWQEHRVLSHGAPARHMCDICGKQFFSVTTLKDHSQIHVTETPYKCDICPKAFKRQNLLVKHISTHDKTKKYKCDECDKVLTSKAGIEVHRKTHHEKSKPHKCNLCEMSFTMRSYLEIHKRVHTGVHPYKCDVCNHTFAHKGGLRRHTLTHTGERPYACTLCDKSFIEKHSLTRHLRHHNNERPYSCPICSRAFHERQKLNQHIKNVHKGQVESNKTESLE